MSTGVKIALLALALIVVWWVAMSPVPERHDHAAVSGSVAMPIRAVAPLAGKAAAAPAHVEEPEPPEHEEPNQPAPSRAPEAPSAATAEPAAPANLPTRQGPLEELVERFANESRGPNSDADDARVREAFSDPAIPSTLLQSAECRRTVCRVALRWTPETDAAYVLGLTRAVGTFSAAVAIEGAGQPESDGTRPLVVLFSLTR